MHTELWTHPCHPSAAIDGIHVEAERLSRSKLRFRYVLRGRIENIVLPPPAEPLRADGLWKTTCFEAFVRPPFGTSYMEFNFSPSGRWAAYDFAAYRAGMVQLCLPGPPRIDVRRSQDMLEADILLSVELPGEGCRLAVNVVVEERYGRSSLWAQTFPGETPDFHHPSCFVNELPPAPAP